MTPPGAGNDSCAGVDAFVALRGPATAAFAQANSAIFGVVVTAFLAGLAWWMAKAKTVLVFGGRDTAFPIMFTLGVVLQAISIALYKSTLYSTTNKPGCQLMGFWWVEGMALMLSAAVVRLTRDLSRAWFSKGAATYKKDLLGAMMGGAGGDDAASVSASSATSGARARFTQTCCTAPRQTLALMWLVAWRPPSAARNEETTALLAFSNTKTFVWILSLLTVVVSGTFVVFFYLSADAYRGVDASGKGCRGCVVSWELIIILAAQAALFGFIMRRLAVSLHSFADAFGVRREIRLATLVSAPWCVASVVLMATDPGDAFYAYSFAWEWFWLLGIFLAWVVGVPWQVYKATAQARSAAVAVTVAASDARDSSRAKQQPQQQQQQQPDPELAKRATTTTSVRDLTRGVALKDALDDAMVLEAFTAFAEEVHIVEAVRFISAVKVWKLNFFDKSESWRVAKAKTIAGLFIYQTGVLQVNISAKQRERIEATLKSAKTVEFTLFDAALADVLGSTEQDSWPRFIKRVKERGGLGPYLASVHGGSVTDMSTTPGSAAATAATTPSATPTLAVRVPS